VLHIYNFNTMKIKINSIMKFKDKNIKRQKEINKENIYLKLSKFPIFLGLFCLVSSILFGILLVRFNILNIIIKNNQVIYIKANSQIIVQED
jgi:hypothetical protein